MRNIADFFTPKHNDVPRETLELYDYYYNFIKEYFKEMSDTIRKCDEPLDQYVVLDVLLKLNVTFADMNINMVNKVKRITPCLLLLMGGGKYRCIDI